MNRLRATKFSTGPHLSWRYLGMGLVGLSTTLSVARVAHALLPVTQVTGSASDGTATGNQAESVPILGVSSGTSVESVAYNDDTNESPMFIQYSSTSPLRTALPGFSAMGWSHRTRGSNNVWGPWTHSIVPAPTNIGWDLLWGDPSMASNPGMPNIVFIGMLAIPHDKLVFVSNLNNSPSPVVLGPVTEDPRTDTVSPLGGGCVARSTDGGQTFSIVGCMRDTSAVASPVLTPHIASSLAFGHAVDGSAMAVTQNPNGGFSAFAAFIDTDINREAVYMMPDITSNNANPFQKDNTVMGNVGAMPDDSVGEIETHVRLLASGTDLWKMSAMFRDSATSNGLSAITFLSQDSTTAVVPAHLKLNLRNRNGGPIGLASDAVIGESVDLGPDANGTEITLRTGPQFAFDVGVNEKMAPELRFVYMAADVPDQLPGAPFQNHATSFHLQGGFCSLQDPQNPKCQIVAQWVTPSFPNAMVLFPAMKFAMPSGSSTPVWKVTFQGRNPQNLAQWAIFQADLVEPGLVPTSPTFSNAGLALLQLTPFQTPCPDVRGASIVPQSFGPNLGAAYWGDYDFMTFDVTSGNFVRSFTDSTLGCDSRLPLTSHNVHVSTVDIPTAPPQATVNLAGVQFGTTGFNICSACNCINSLPDATITCSPQLDANGAPTTTPVEVQQELGCSDGHGALVTVTCNGTTSSSGGSGGLGGLDVGVTLNIEKDCGSFFQTPNDSNPTFTAVDVLPGQSSTNSQFLDVCDAFGGTSGPCSIFANGGSCTFNDFDANVTVSTTGGF
jgi:hypothetical protein